jgi:hypothetical protein
VPELRYALAGRAVSGTDGTEGEWSATISVEVAHAGQDQRAELRLALKSARSR